MKVALAGALAAVRHARAFELFYAELQSARELPAYRKLLTALLAGFGALGDARAAAVLTDFVNGSVPALQAVALESLGNLALPETFDLIAGVLRDTQRSPDIRISSAKALANYGGIAAAKVLSDQLGTEKDTRVRRAINDALERLGGRPDFQKLSVTGSPARLRW